MPIMGYKSTRLLTRLRRVNEVKEHDMMWNNVGWYVYLTNAMSNEIGRMLGLSRTPYCVGRYKEFDAQGEEVMSERIFIQTGGRYTNDHLKEYEVMDAERCKLVCKLLERKLTDEDRRQIEIEYVARARKLGIIFD